MLKRMCILFSCLVVIGSVALALPACAEMTEEEYIAIALQKEAAAGAILEEAKGLKNEAKYEDALAVLERIPAEYPGTQPEGYAMFERGLIFVFTGKYDNAIAQANAVAGFEAEHPNPTLARWGTCLMGDALVAKGLTEAGIVEYLKVAALQQVADTMPTTYARKALGALLDRQLKENVQLTAHYVLGLDKLGKQGKAQALAIVAQYKALQDRVDWALTIIEEMQALLPSEKSEIQWATDRVALSVKHDNTTFRDWAAGVVNKIVESPDSNPVTLLEARTWMEGYNQLVVDAQ